MITPDLTSPEKTWHFADPSQHGIQSCWECRYGTIIPGANNELQCLRGMEWEGVNTGNQFRCPEWRQKTTELYPQNTTLPF